MNSVDVEYFYELCDDTLAERINELRQVLVIVNTVIMSETI